MLWDRLILSTADIICTNRDMRQKTLESFRGLEARSILIGKGIGTLPVRELWSLFDRTRFAIARLRELELSQFGLTIEQASVIYVLTSRGGPMTAKELEDITMRQHHSVSMLVNGMVRMGLVSKEKNPREKRNRISITDVGRGLSLSMTNTAIEEAFAALNEKERQQLTGFLDRLLVKARSCLGFDAASIRIGREVISEDLSLPVRELWSLLDRTRFAISRVRELELLQFGLTVEQSSILHLLSYPGRVTTARMIEDQTMRRQHSVSALIKGMTKMGLVNKVKNPGERQYRIILTPSGQSLFEKVTVESLEAILTSLSEKERDQMGILLNSLLERSRYLLGIPFKPPLWQYLAKSHPEIGSILN